MRIQAPQQLAPGIIKSHSNGRDPKKILLIALGGLYAAYLVFLGVSTGVDSVYTAKLSTDIEKTTQEIDTLYNKNAEFALYVQNKAFLDTMNIPDFSVYLADLNTKIPEGTRTESIQISKSGVSKNDIYTLSLVLESVPPLREIGRVIDTLESSTYFENVSIASASVNTSSTGTSTFSYPISMTITPNSASN